MNAFLDAIGWLLAPEQYSGPNSIPVLIAQHLAYSAAAVAIAALIAIPLGWYIGHTGKGRELAVSLSGAARAIPSFGLLVLLVLLMGVLHKPEAALITFVILAIPSLLAGAYTGFEAIDRQVVDAARAVGMTEWQILWRVEVPLGLPLLLGGLRSATLQVIATVTIGAYIGLGGLGLPIIQGIQLRAIDQVLGGAILVAALALLLDLILALAQRAAVAPGVRADSHSAADASPTIQPARTANPS